MDYCFYCDGLVARRSQSLGDHFPIPKRFGGDVIVPCCESCHDMKDRFRLEDWPVEWVSRAISEFPKLSREARIFFAKIIVMLTEEKREVLSPIPWGG